MSDLPNGWRAHGPGVSNRGVLRSTLEFNFSYFANLKRVDITLNRGKPFYLAIPPRSDGQRAGFLQQLLAAPAMHPIQPIRSSISLSTQRSRRKGALPFRRQGRRTDPASFPYRDARAGGDDETISLDYAVIDGHWVIVHGTFSPTMHARSYLQDDRRRNVHRYCFSVRIRRTRVWPDAYAEDRLPLRSR